MFTSFGKATIISYMRVRRKNGEIEYYKNIDNQSIKITEKEYKKMNKGKRE